MTVRTLAEIPEIESLAISIYRPTPEQNHTGLFYRNDENFFRVLHLAFHFDLRDEEAKDDARCTPLSLDPTNQEIVAVFAGRVRDAEPRIPYGITQEGDCFDRDGNYIRGPLGSGLTCATFITSMFKALSLPMIDETSWVARAEDQAWRDKIVKVMEDLREHYDIDQNHIERVRSDPVACRIRPEEVAAAGTFAGWPARLEDIEELAKEIADSLG